MTDTPVTSGSDILSVKGDPNLAGGSGSGFAGPQINFAPMETTVDLLQKEAVQKRWEQRQQDIQAATDRAKYISQLTANGGSIFNMKGPDGSNLSYNILPQDRELLNKRTEDLIHAVNENPDGFEYDEGIKKMELERNQLLNFAQQRAMFDTDHRLKAAGSFDPEDRGGYLQTIDKEIDQHPLTDYHTPSPYFAQPAITKDDFLSNPNEARNEKNMTLVKDDPEKGEKTFIIGGQYRSDPRMLQRGDPMYPKAIQWGAKLINSPIAHDYGRITALNQAAYNQNEVRGLKEGDQGYLPPLFVIDPQTGAASFAESDPEKLALHAAAVLDAEKNGQGYKRAYTPEETEKIKEDREKRATEKRRLDIEQERVDIERNKGKNPTAEQLKEEQERLAGLNAYTEVQKVFDPSNYSDRNKINFNNPLTNLARSKEIAAVGNAGYNKDDYDFYKVPKNIATEKYIGIQAPVTTEETTEKGPPDQNKTTTTTKSKSSTLKGASDVADNVVMAHNKKTGEGHLLYIKDGAVVADVNKRTAIANGLKHESRYDEKVYANPTTYGQQFYDQQEQGSGQPQPAPSQTNATPQQIPKIEKRIMENGKKIGIFNGKKYEITGRNPDGSYVGIPLE